MLKPETLIPDDGLEPLRAAMREPVEHIALELTRLAGQVLELTGKDDALHEFLFQNLLHSRFSHECAAHTLAVQSFQAARERGASVAPARRNSVLVLADAAHSAPARRNSVLVLADAAHSALVRPARE